MESKNHALQERFLREKANRGYTEYTLENYRSGISIFLNFLGRKDVTRTDREDIERYLDYLRKRESRLAPGGKGGKIKLLTVKSYMKRASLLLEWLEDNDLIAKNPARKIVREIRVEKVKRKAISLEDVRKIVRAAANPRDRAIILTMGIAGLRRGEVANLKLSDVDFSASEIFVRMGKGKKDRVVVMDMELVEALKVWLVYRDSMNPKCDYLFCNQHTLARISSNLVYHIVKGAAEKAGVSNAFPHKLRHSAATFMHDSGMDILEIKEQLGHSDISTTEGYIDTSEAKRRQGMSRMPSLNVMG